MKYTCFKCKKDFENNGGLNQVCGDCLNDLRLELKFLYKTKPEKVKKAIDIKK